MIEVPHSATDEAKKERPKIDIKMPLGQLLFDCRTTMDRNPIGKGFTGLKIHPLILQITERVRPSQENPGLLKKAAEKVAGVFKNPAVATKDTDTPLVHAIGVAAEKLGIAGNTTITEDDVEALVQATKEILEKE